MQTRWPTFGQVATAVALLWGGAWALNRATRRIEGTSMVPTLHPGDLVVIRRARRVRVGQLVVVRDPRQPSRTVVKRVVEVSAAGVEVRGDNPVASTDSRTFGAVPLDHVEAIVLFRWAISRGRRGERVRSPQRWG